MQPPYFDVLLWLIVGVVIGFIVCVAFLQPPATQPQGPSSLLQNTTNATPISPALPSPQLPVLNLTIINVSGCDKCLAAADLAQQLESVVANYNITLGTVRTVASDSPDGKALISRYGINKLPSLVAVGGPGLNEDFVSIWASQVGTQESDGALVLRELYAPYYDADNGTIVGLVKAIAINASCDQCRDASSYIEALESPTVQMTFVEKAFLDENDSAAKELISKYNITRLPTILLSKDVTAYTVYDAFLAGVGSFDGEWYVLRNVSPPYVGLSGNRSIRGLVDAILLVNNSCTDCFNASSFSEYLAGSAGFYVANTTTYEINSTKGLALIKKYNITRIPATLYSPEASAYEEFTPIWLQENNTVEDDGWFVFRAYELLGDVAYQNISG